MSVGIEKFRQHNVYGDWEFEAADEGLPASWIYSVRCGSDDGLSEKGRAQKRRRIENHGYSYIRGKNVYISSAQLPFGQSWRNAWQDLRQATIPAPKASRHARDTIDRTLDWLKNQSEHTRTPELPGDISFNDAETTPSRQSRVQANRSMYPAKSGSLGRHSPSKSRVPTSISSVTIQSKDNSTRKASRANAQRLDQVSEGDHTVNVIPFEASTLSTKLIPSKQPVRTSLERKLKISQSSPSGKGMIQVRKDRESPTRDTTTKADDVGNSNSEEHIKSATTRQIKTVERTLLPTSTAQVLQPKANNKALPPQADQTSFKMDVSSRSELSKVNVRPNDTMNTNVTHVQSTLISRVDVDRTLSHVSGFTPVPYSTAQSIQTDLSSTRSPRRAVSTVLSYHDIEEAAERCASAIPKTRKLRQRRSHRARGKAEGLNSASTTPAPLATEGAANQWLQLRHPLVASPMPGRDSPGFSYRKVVSQVPLPQAQTASEPDTMEANTTNTARSSVTMGEDVVHNRSSAEAKEVDRVSADQGPNPGEIVRGDGPITVGKNGDQTKRSGDGVEQGPKNEEYIQRQSPTAEWKAGHARTPASNSNSRAGFANRLVKPMDDEEEEEDQQSNGERNGTKTSTLDANKKGDQNKLSTSAGHSVTQSTNAIKAGALSLSSGQPAQIQADSDLSTQAAFLRAQQLFHDDMLSPVSTPTASANTRDQLDQPAITPFRKINSQLKNTKQTPNLSTQAMFDEADLAYSTVKKSKAKKRTSFAAVPNDKNEEIGAVVAQAKDVIHAPAKSPLPKPSFLASNTRNSLSGLLSFLSSTDALDLRQNISTPPVISSQLSVNKALPSSAAPVPSWMSSMNTPFGSNSSRPNFMTSLSLQEAQRSQEDVEADSYLADATSFLAEPLSLGSA